MTLQQITADDIAGWDSLDDIAASFEELGLERRPSVGEEDEVVLKLAETEFIKLVEADAGESASDHKPEGNWYQRTNFVATDDYEEFTFLTYDRDRQHGRQKYRKLSFTKEQMTSESGEKHTILQKLNRFEYGSIKALRELYDTKKVVEDFYEEFEELRTDLVDEVTGIPDDREDAKERYVQVIFDRLIFLYFIQEKRLLDTNTDYLHEKPTEVAGENGDHYEKFYKPLFFDYLAENKDDVENFGDLPYLNGGLFSRSPVEEEFEDARLGDGPERTNELFAEILDFLLDWNWNVAEHLDIADPKNLSPAILGHIFERTVNQKEKGAYYTPEEITSHMAEQTIHPNLLDQLNELVDAEYEEVDEVFALSKIEMGADGEVAIADGGMTRQAPVAEVDTDHVETLYHDVLKETKVLDPAVGSGAFLLAAQEIFLDVYLHCIEHFQRLFAEGKVGELSGETRDEIEKIRDSEGNETLYAKREIILSNLYGVDIDEGAVEICKLRLWLSMVADIEGEPGDVEPLPNIDFNIRSGDSLVGFESTEVAVDGQKLLITELLKEDLEEYQEKIDRYKSTEENISQLRNKLDSLHDEMQQKLNGWFADLPDVKVEDEISGAEEIREVISASDTEAKLKLKFDNPIDDDLDQQLNALGFRTWKTSANLEMDNNDVLAGKPEEIFEIVPQSRLARSFVERGLLEEDIDKLDPFHWVMEFPDAYNEGNEGFDVIIENPPYIRVENIESLKKKIYKDRFKTAYGRCDIYVPFIQRTTEILHEQGRYGCITSNQFMSAQYGKKIREYLPQETGIHELVDFTNYSPFEGIATYSAILIGGRQQTSLIDCTVLRSEEAVEFFMSDKTSTGDESPIIEFTLPIEFLEPDQWLILPDDERRIVNVLSDACSKTLGDIATVGSPLWTGKDELLKAVIKAETEDKYTVSNERLEADVESKFWRRLIGASETGNWTVDEPKKVVFFPYRKQGNKYNLIPEEEFEETDSYQVLEPYKDELLDERRDSGESFRERGKAWYSLGRRGTPDLYEKNKIAIGGTINGPGFSLDTNGYLVARGAGNARGIATDLLDDYFLLGYLNSRAVYGYLKSIASPKRGGYISVDNNVLERVPVPTIEVKKSTHQEVRNLLEDSSNTDDLLQKIKQGGVSSHFSGDVSCVEVCAGIIREVSRRLCVDRDSLSNEVVQKFEEINHFAVYELVGFSEEDIAVIEENL